MDEKRIEQIFQGLDLLEEIELAADPLPLGPKYIHEKIAECRNQIEKVEKWVLEVNRAERGYEQQLNASQAEYEIHFADKLVNDPEVAKQRSVDERKAVVNNQLKGVLEEIKQAKQSLNSLKFLRKSLDLKSKNLEKLNSDIRLQYNTLKSELELEKRWGQVEDDGDGDILTGEKPKKKTAPPPIDEEENEDVMKALEGLSVPDPVPASEPADSTPDLSDILGETVKTNLKQTVDPVPAPAHAVAPKVVKNEDEPEEESEDVVNLFASFSESSRPLPTPPKWREKDGIENHPETGEDQSSLDAILANMEVPDEPKPAKASTAPSVPTFSEVDYASILGLNDN